MGRKGGVGMPDGLYEALERYAGLGVRAMHMPGHKRNASRARYLTALGARLDITEIDGFDNLHDPKGLLKDAMARAARLWGSERAFFLVNGSTCGILAGIRAATEPGDRVIVARNSHQSVYHALELMDLDACYLLPEYDRALGAYGSVAPDAVERALDECPSARLVVVTSPTYEGAVSDIAAISRLTHARGVPLMVDEAHGAHLGFSPSFPPGAVAAGADIAVQSLHKTLPSLTQTAIAHVGGLIDPERFQAQLDIFETSSPSYLLMASIDGCVRLIEREGKEAFARWAKELDAFDRAARGLTHLSLPGHGAPSGLMAHAFDRSKILISTRGADITGPRLSEALRARYSIELEMAACDHALAMTGLIEPDGALQALAGALLEIDRELAPSAEGEPFEAPAIPERALPIARATRMPREAAPLAESLGRVSAQYAWAYPPGVPLIAPGERVDRRFLQEARRCADAGVPLKGGPADGMLWLIRGA